MGTRLMKPMTTTSQPTIQAPQRADEWHRLMRLVIEQAEKMQDRRLTGLRKALADGQAERHLRMMGIISEADLHREFPAKES